MNDFEKKYIKYKLKYNIIKQKLNGLGKYYLDNNDFVDIIYNNNKLLEEIQSKFQKIQVYNNDFFGNILVIDDDLQLTQHDEKNYHEMIVHVPLNYKENAKKILIIGGGDCGTLLEITKHDNVEEIFMIEIDEEVINISKKYFPELTNSLNDTRLKLIIEDGASWIKNNIIQFNNYFDIIIIDSTDYTTSMTLFTQEFYNNICKVLNNNGILNFNCMSLSWEKNEEQQVYDEMHKLFKYVFLYQVFIPTYASGHYTFCFCSNKIDPINTPINFQLYNKKKIKTKYYNKDIHLASFYLPNSSNLSKNITKERLGSTFLIDIKNIHFSKLNDIRLLEDMLEEICNKYNLTIVDKIKKQFQPFGISINILLEESHISIHTWPEKEKCCIDLFTCSDFKWNINNDETMINIIHKYLLCLDKDIHVKCIEREI